MLLRLFSSEKLQVDRRIFKAVHSLELLVNSSMNF
jgi:hypothetical protein